MMILATSAWTMILTTVVPTPMSLQVPFVFDAMHVLTKCLTDRGPNATPANEAAKSQWACVAGTI